MSAGQYTEKFAIIIVTILSSSIVIGFIRGLMVYGRRSLLQTRLYGSSCTRPTPLLGKTRSFTLLFVCCWRIYRRSKRLGAQVLMRRGYGEFRR